MALHWSIQRVKDVEEITGDADQRGITDTIVWASLVYDLGRVTEKNVDEWLFRQEFVRRVDDFYPFYRGTKRSMLTRADIKRRIGLETNVTTTSRAAFQRKLIDKVVNDIKRLLKNA
jgi:hypothetical protein